MVSVAGKRKLKTVFRIQNLITLCLIVLIIKLSRLRRDVKFVGDSAHIDCWLSNFFKVLTTVGGLSNLVERRQLKDFLMLVGTVI